ncbi:MAG: DUF4157 domain-containing protein [Chloroflexi bacterium]|nr:DUF4157 domain-containing protein [Chloroflexota bacterium]
MSRPPVKISPTAIERLRPYGDEQSLRDARIRVTPPWSWVPRVLGATATTLGNDICFRTGRYREHDAIGLALIAHECRHVRQYREMGAVTFLVQYLLGALRVRFRHAAHPLELEPLVVQVRARAELRVALDAEQA